MKTGTTKPVRCAIYTRVSTEHGLEQDFNSLDAQHDAAQAFPQSGPRRVDPRGIGVSRLFDPPAEWSRQFRMLGLPS